MRVGAANRFAARKGAHQDQQRGLGQVEVGEQPVHHPEAVARGDEQIRLATASHAAAGLQCPQRRGADGHHWPSLGLGAGDGLRCLGRQRVALTVHVVLRQVFGAHRQEGARTHMQRQVCAFDAARSQRRQQRLIKVQAGRGGGHRARLAGEHGLIARLVGLIRLVLDVGRQRQFTQPLQHPGCRCIEADAQHHAARLARRDDRGALRGVFRPEIQPAVRLGWMAGTHHRQHLVLAVDALDHHLDAPAAFLAPGQPRMDDPRVVEHQQAAGRDEFRQIGQQPVGSGGSGRLRGRVHCRLRVCMGLHGGGIDAGTSRTGHRGSAGLGQPHQRRHIQQSPAGALLGWVLCNQFLGQVIVEIGQLHRDGSGKGVDITGRGKVPRHVMASCRRAGLCEDPALHQSGAGAIAGQLGLQAWRGRHVLKAMTLPEAHRTGQRHQPQVAQTLPAGGRHGGCQQALGNTPAMPFRAHGAVVDEPVPARFGQCIQQYPQCGRQPVVPRIRDQIARHPVAGQRHQASLRRKLPAVPEERHRLQHRQAGIGLRLHLHQLRQVGFFQRRYLYGHMAQTMVRER